MIACRFLFYLDNDSPHLVPPHTPGGMADLGTKIWILSASATPRLLVHLLVHGPPMLRIDPYHDVIPVRTIALAIHHSTGKPNTLNSTAISESFTASQRV